MFANLALSCVRANELLKKYGSPLYVKRSRSFTKYDNSILLTLLLIIIRIFILLVLPMVILIYSRFFGQSNWVIHSNTAGDVYLALKVDFTLQQIVYSGSNLKREEMIQLLKWGVATLNLDSISQLDLCCHIYQKF